MLTLVDELLLVAYDDRTGRNQAQHLELGLGGAILLELTLTERVDVVKGHVAVTNSAPTGDPILDGALGAIEADKPRRPPFLVQRLAKGRKDTVVDALVARGVLRHQQSKVLKFFTVNRYLPADSAGEADAVARLNTAVDSGIASDSRTAALASLVYALNLTRAVFPQRNQRETRKTLKAIANGSWAGEATRKAVEAAQAAVMAGITAATVASTNAATSG